MPLGWLNASRMQQKNAAGAGKTKTPEGYPSGVKVFRLSDAGSQTGWGVRRRERPKNPV